MQIEFHGLQFQASRITCYLWSPWRASALEHRLFNEIKQIDGGTLESGPDELRVQLTSVEAWRQAKHNMTRLLKGWQEEATTFGKERRVYRWLFEGDTDEHGYDHANDVACLWIYLRAGIERGELDDGEPVEWIDFSGFGLRLWPIDGRIKSGAGDKGDLG